MRIAPPFLMLVTAAALSISSAMADTVGPASYSIQFQGVPGAVDASGASPQSGSYNYYGGAFEVNASATTTSQPFAGFDLTSSDCTSGFPSCSVGNYYSVTAETDYYIEVSGPTGVTVPYYLNANGVLTHTGPSYPGLLVTLTDPDGHELMGVDPTFNGRPYCPINCPSVAIGDVELLSDTQYEISIRADATADTFASSKTMGWADAYIFIDPTFAGGDQFSLLISPGIENSPNSILPMPEPSTWAMMLIAFAGLGGFASYRRLQRVSAAASV
jgi:hypothetical protein